MGWLHHLSCCHSHGGGWRGTIERMNTFRPRIALNIDLGELAGEDPELYQAAHWANIACGGHAGDKESMQRALDHCHHNGAQPGWHPGYADRESFGRRVLPLPPAQVAEQVLEQVTRLADLAAEQGQTLRHLKLHGALYHQVDREPALAEAVLQALTPYLRSDLRVLGPAGHHWERRVRAHGCVFVQEAFADRGRQRDADGRWQLIPRDQPGAVLEDWEYIQDQLEQFATESTVGSVCVHGDHAGAAQRALQVRQWLDHAA